MHAHATVAARAGVSICRLLAIMRQSVPGICDYKTHRQT